jgi:hypothetical protein
MKRRSPLLLVAIVALYLLLEIVLLVTQPEPAKVFRLLIAGVLGFFMLRGSSVAIFIWVALSVLAAIYGFVWVFKTIHTNSLTAIASGLFATLALAQALYLMLSRSVRAHVASA